MDLNYFNVGWYWLNFCFRPPFLSLHKSLASSSCQHHFFLCWCWNGFYVDNEYSVYLKVDANHQLLVKFYLKNNDQDVLGYVEQGLWGYHPIANDKEHAKNEERGILRPIFPHLFDKYLKNLKDYCHKSSQGIKIATNSFHFIQKWSVSLHMFSLLNEISLKASLYNYRWIR